MEVYGYGYVTKPMANVQRSTVYKTLRGKFIPMENIRIDTLNENENRPELERILSEARSGDTLLILNYRTLGTTAQFRKWWHYIVMELKLNILVVNEQEDSGVDYFSSTDYSLERYSEEEIEKRWEKLKETVFERTSRKIGRSNAELTNAFIEAYWAFQEFCVTPNEAYDHAGVSKATFYSLCKEYEQTDEYLIRLKERPKLWGYPKRGGLGKELDKLFFAVENQKKGLEESCRELELPVLSELEYHRCLLAKKGGRSLQFAMEKANSKENFFKNQKSF